MTRRSASVNLVVEKGGRLVTPPVACGLLPGICRAHLLETEQIHEEVGMVDDLWQAKQLYAINSVRMWMPAVMVGGNRAQTGTTQIVGFPLPLGDG